MAHGVNCQFSGLTPRAKKTDGQQRSVPWLPAARLPVDPVKSKRVESLFEQWRRASRPAVEGGILPPGQIRPPCVRAYIYRPFRPVTPIPPGWKPRLHVSQDGRRRAFQTRSNRPHPPRTRRRKSVQISAPVRGLKLPLPFELEPVVDGWGFQPPTINVEPSTL
jgi:hypothetical protein